jgi:hypothetical protein
MRFIPVPIDFAAWRRPRPQYEVHVRHQFELGGFDVSPGASIDLDEFGLSFLRTLVLDSRAIKVKYRMIDPQDLNVIFPEWEYDLYK